MTHPPSPSDGSAPSGLPPQPQPIPEPAPPEGTAPPAASAGHDGSAPPAASAGHDGSGAPAGPPPGTDLAADLGAALTFTGNALLRNLVAFLTAGFIYAVIMGVIILGGVVAAVMLMMSRIDRWSGTDGATGAAPLTEILLFYAVLFGIALLTVPVVVLWQSGSGRAAEEILEGSRPSIRQALIGPGRVFLTALLVLAAITVGFLLLYIPGLIVSVLLMFAVPAAARGASPLDAVRESVQLVRGNPGTAIVAYLVLSVITSVASSLVIPMIVAVPFALLFELGMYERLRGRQLPEPARG